MTKREMFNLIATVNSDNKEIVDFCKHEVALLDNKKSKSGQSKTQKENVILMDKIVSALGKCEIPVTITELQNEVAEMGTYSNQKLSALLKKLVESGRVIKTVDKKKSYFSVATDEDGSAEYLDSEVTV